MRASTEVQTPRARILIADDEAHVREVLRHFLTRKGYLVSAVEDGRGVLDTVSTFQPDVIVVDMVMPGLTGADVLTALRRAGVTVPAILISAYDVVVREAKRSGITWATRADRTGRRGRATCQRASGLASRISVRRGGASRRSGAPPRVSSSPRTVRPRTQ